MKHSTIFVIGLVLTVFLLSTSAMMQQDDRSDARQTGPALDETQQSYVSDGPLHKLILDAQDEATYSALRDKGAIVEEINYGSFKMLIVNQQPLGGRAQLQATALSIHDSMNLIALNGYTLDTTNPDATYAQLPADLRKPDIADALARGVQPRGGLYIVQFVGPIQDAWLDALKATGVKVISYIASNAYIVRADSRAAALVVSLLKQNPAVQFVGDYEPAFRLSPGLHAARGKGGDVVDVTVQVVDGPDAKDTIANLTALANEFVQTYRVLDYHNVELKVSSARLAQIAGYDGVFAVEERGQRRKLDEAQGQIVAGNLTGNSPTGPGYLSWLAGKGFTSSQFTSFSVNVVDDTYTLQGHPDFPSGRVAFQNNPTNQSGALGGHGFLNANIIGGFNNGTGTAVEDALGFNYGLGISPFARVGVTAIFGSTASSGTAWENTGYGQGARISSNSWGFQTATGGPVADYDANSQSYDSLVRDAQPGTAGLQQLSIIFAAGNDGSGANTVSSPATAKNIISVGASENVRQTGTDGCGIANTGADSANDIISFSSRGPVNSLGGDGRIKPDIVAPGTHVEAGVPQSNYNGSSVCNQFFPAGQTLYGWSSGTSHSTPAVAGGAALVYQDFLNKSLPAPSPAMVKAALMNSAAYMTGVGANDTLPSNNQGMGRMDLGRAFDGEARIRVDQTQVLGATGQTFQVTGSVANTGKPFRVTLAWTDAPGPTTGAPWVNNLDLEVTINGTTFKGNVFSGANSASGGTADGKNNVESVFLPAGTSGSFTITVRGTNIAGDGVPGNADTTDQDFALLVYNANSGTPTSPAIGVSPSSLSFTATAGGANPASQSLSITNTGGGTLTWSASGNTTWLGISPASGTAPSAVTVSANVAGLAAGTYSAAITVTGTGATNSPVTVPVTLTVTNGGAQQLLGNPGFESGNTIWTATAGVITNSSAQAAHGGVWKAWLDGYGTTHTDTLRQNVTIPSTATTATLTFWLHIDTAETTTTTAFDTMRVQVRDTSGTVLSTLATFSNLNRAAGYSQKSFNLISFKGQTIQIFFTATEDSS
ncbi:MAG TPA: S8 family serine peptidase, partial [Blastocatellia bacterium]|nr:S8 family serine peptidase [Blastocatellia bacterium]